MENTATDIKTCLRENDLLILICCDIQQEDMDYIYNPTTNHQPNHHFTFGIISLQWSHIEPRVPIWSFVKGLKLLFLKLFKGRHKRPILPNIVNLAQPLSPDIDWLQMRNGYSEGCAWHRYYVEHAELWSRKSGWASGCTVDRYTQHIKGEAIWTLQICR